MKSSPEARLSLVLVAAALLVLPLSEAALQIFPKVQAQDQAANEAVTDEVTPSAAGSFVEDIEDEVSEGEGAEANDSAFGQNYLDEVEGKTFLTPLQEELDFFAKNDSRLVIAPEDKKKLRDHKVDIRVTDYLNELVKPKELGGYGFERIRVNRIFKNYDTDGTGRFDRESKEADEGDQFISTHNRGQAVDISEIGSVTCKLIEKRHLGGNTTRWQAPRPIKVAWQSVDGINRTPTPKSPSLMETSTTMTAESILRMMNESGEMDQTVEIVKGMNLESILTYIGTNIYLKNIGVTKISSDPLADSLIHVAGAMVLEKSLPELPDGLAIADNGEDARIGLAKARLEEALNMPPGSLRGYGWNKLLESAGKRSLENSLGLPALYLDTHQLKDLENISTAQAAFEHLSRGDDAFGFIAGTLEKIKNKDQEGLRLAGVNVLGKSFKLSQAQQALLEQAVRSKQPPKLDPESFPVGHAASPEDLRHIFSENPEEQRQAQEALKQLGTEFLRQAAAKIAGKKYEGVTENILDRLLGNGTISLGDLKRQVGAVKVGTEAGLSANEQKAIADNRQAGGIEAAIADQINKEFELEGTAALTVNDARAMLRGGSSWAEKIGGAQADQALGWNKGTGLKIIQRKAKLADGAAEIFVNGFGQILGLDPETTFTLQGDVRNNYGRALVAQHLGLKLGGNQGAEAVNQAELYQAFNLTERRSLAQLRADQNYWDSSATMEALASSDQRLGAPAGTSMGFLRGDLNQDGFLNRVAEGAIGQVAINQVWEHFGLEGQLQLSSNEGKLLLDVLKNWNGANFEQKDQALQLFYKVVGRSLDSKTGFAIDFFISYLTDPNSTEATQKLLNQGIRQLAGAIGVNLGGFDDKALAVMTDRIIKVYNGQASKEDREALVGQILQATSIPDQYKTDAEAFLRGDLKTVLSGWSAAIWEKFANQYLPENGRLTYQELRQTFVFEDQAAIQDEALGILADSGQEGLWSGLSEEQRQELLNQARRQLVDQARDNTQYKLSDAFIEQATGGDLPANFSRVMLTGSDQQRADLLLRFGLTRIDSAIKAVEPSYQEGTLEKVFNGQLSAAAADQLVLTIINRSGVSFGAFDNAFIQQFYTFLKARNKTDFFTSDTYNGMWSYLDGWLEQTIGIGVLPAGVGRSVYYASVNGWNPNAGIVQNGAVIVPSLNQLGEGFLVSRLSEWGDKSFGLPTGATYRFYQAATSLKATSRALAAARATGDAAKISQASSALSKAQAELTVIAITVALEACEACQQFFASVDKAIAAPPGFTNAAVAGAIAMAFGLGPAGLIIAAAIYLFGVYSVEFLCPVPPKDTWAEPAFDPEFDRLDYTWGDYYDDPAHLVKDNPAPGENPFDWDNGLPFADGNDPGLWRAWARYKTGQLLDATLRYGTSKQRPNKPKQVITYRQANVEFFTPRVKQAFGEMALTNPAVGFGYSQKTTKTTNWVHVAFGGLF